MSGQPTINPTDASKFRQQYLANLALQANLDDQNLQANKIYKKTGMTPTQPTDTRSTAEILADTERLKIEVRSQLSQIADGTNADAIVQQLDPNQLQFLAQHIDEIVKDIKPKYKYGVDALSFILYFQSYMDKANATNEVSFGLQQQMGRDILMGVQQIQRDMVNPQMLGQVRDEVNQSTNLMNVSLHQAIMRDIANLQQFLPSRDFIVQIAQIQDANTLSLVQQTLNLAYQNFPTNQQLIPLLQQLQVGLSRRDRQYVDRIGQQLEQLLAVDPASADQVRFLRQLIEQQQGGSEIGSVSTEQSQTSPRSRRIEELGASQKSNLRGHYRPSDSFGDNPTKAELKEYIRTMKGYAGNLIQYKDLGLPTISADYSVPKLRNAIASLNERVASQIEDRDNPLPRGNTPSGRGLSKQIKVIKGNGLVYYKARPLEIDTTKGIMPQSKYVPFGRFAIDTHRLNDDIISLKRGKGINVSGFPVVRVSKHLGAVVRDIVGGGQPQYNNLSMLDEQEKVYLHKLAKSSNILHRLTIPTPNRSEDEKDINQFEVMKGEILNGNDNTDMIRRFKLLINKLINKDLLPRGQAKELLLELASIGY
jgi:hypothetical protein